jgi:AT-rich interactive domain-containing protein 2
MPKVIRTQANLLPPPPPKPRLDEDSDSAASTANSLVSSGGAVSTDGENSLTSFEGILLNGIPHATDTDAANDKSNDDSRSNDSTKDLKGGVKMKGMLADLLEKKVVTKEPMINGVMGKEIRISDKGLEIVENHVDKVLKQENSSSSETQLTEQIKLGVKRSATVITEAQDAKKPLLTPPINGNAHASETEDISNNEMKVEPQEVKYEPHMLKQEVTPGPMRQLIIAQPATSDASTSQAQQIIMAPRQIIMAPGSLPQGQVMISQGQLQGNSQLKGQIIVQGGQRQVLVQNSQVLVSSGQMVSQPMFVSAQSGGSQFIVTQAMQGSVVSASGQSYVISQSQGLQGQQPTVLVTQTPQQQGTNAKTIIILHQQGAGQKLVTPQGQQVMVQLPRSAVQGGNTTLQGLTLSQGAGGQVTVTLPGNVPVMARTIMTTSGATFVQQSLTRTLAPAGTMTKPVQTTTQAVITNQVKKAFPSATPVCAAQANNRPSMVSPTPPRPSTPRTLASEAENKVSNGPTTTTASNPKPPETSPFLCEWRGCMR